MNAADTALTQGFTELLASAGDSVTFRGAAVSAVINWNPQAREGKEPIPSFSAEQKSEIEIPMGSLASAPKVGEFVTTTTPIGTARHRIEKVRLNGLAYVLTCEVTR